MWAELIYGVDVYPLLYALWGAVAIYWVALAGLAVWRLRRARRGRPLGAMGPRLWATLQETLTQRGIWRVPLAGAGHLAMLAGWVLVLVGFVGTHYLAPRGLPWQQSGATHVLADLGALLAILGLAAAGWRRHVSRQTPATGLDVGLWGLLVVGVLAGLSGQGLLVAIAQPPWRKVAFLSNALGSLLTALPEGTLRSAYGLAWSVLHASLLGMAVLLPLTKWRHMLLAPGSVLSRPGAPLARLAPLDLSGREPFGALRRRDLTRKELLDTWACTRCGRCSAACPAQQAGRALDPLGIVQGLADAHGSAPLAEQVGEATLWDCTTCLACVTACPVGISPLDMVIDLRRERVLEAATFPSPLAEVFRALERRGNPWGLSTATAPDLPVRGDGEHCEVLLWLGCMGRQDARARRAARAMVAVLQECGVSVATLGDREECCGDPARRLGNEHLWRELAEKRRAVLSAGGYGRIVSLCPHCVNALANEYADLGTPLAASHATVYLAELAQQGRLALPAAQTEDGLPARTVTYHDPCYLARGLGQAGAARELLALLPGMALQELARHGDAALCCGAGGGQMWLESEAARLEEPRVAEIARLGAGTCATACPYCATMLGDGLQRAGDGTMVRDVVELLAEALGLTERADQERLGVDE